MDPTTVPHKELKKCVNKIKGNDMTEIIDGTPSTVVEEVKLSKEEFDKLVKTSAEKAQNEANMVAEITDLRKKNRELAETKKPEIVAPLTDVSKEVQAEFERRDREAIKIASEQATVEFLDSHPEFSKENDVGGLKFAAFQKALARVALNGVKTKEDYAQVLNDAMRLTGEVTPSMPNYSSTPRTAISVPGMAPAAQLSTPELKLVQNSFGGDVEKYLKLKAKRPEYVEELLRWVRN